MKIPISYALKISNVKTFLFFAGQVPSVAILLSVIKRKKRLTFICFMIKNKSKASFFPTWLSFTTKVVYFWQTSSRICRYCLLILNKMHECKLHFLGPSWFLQVWTGLFESRATKGYPNKGKDNHFRVSIHCRVSSILY